MSFCQNHVNHHCNHAHNCSNRAHRKCQPPSSMSKKHDQIPHILCRSSKQLKKIVEQNNEQSECHFRSNYRQSSAGRKCAACDRLAKELDLKEKEILELRKENQSGQRKAAKASEENRQLHGVIEYYREELERIIKCGELDMKNEIKRHLKENTQLAGKNKFLLNKLAELEEVVPKLTHEIEQWQQKCNTLKKQKHELALHFNQLVQKLKKTQTSESKQDIQKEADKKKYSQIETRYQIIIEQTNRSVESLTKENKKLYSTNKDLLAQVEVLKQKMINAEKISKMEQESSNQKQIVLKKKLEACNREIKELRDSVAKLEQALKLKEEELMFSKKVVEKQLKIIKENKELFEQVKQDMGESRGHGLEENKENEGGRKQNKQEEYVSQLKNQIKVLREKIVVLEGKGPGHSIQNIEHYIMTIGASEAFRRIIEQKNIYIKKLIREKAALLQKTG